jgi:putative transposase
VSVTPANVHDTKGARYALNKIAKRQRKQTIKKVFADKGYQGPALAEWVLDKFGAVVETTKNLAKIAKEFVPAKKRWVVERSFAWVGDYYRLSVDRERLCVNSMTMVRLAFIRIMLRRLYPG